MSMTPTQYLKQGSTQAALAARLSISRAQLSRLLTGKRRWTPRLAAKMEQITDGAVSAGELLAHVIPPGYVLHRAGDHDDHTHDQGAAQ